MSPGVTINSEIPARISMLRGCCCCCSTVELPSESKYVCVCVFCENVSACSASEPVSACSASKPFIPFSLVPAFSTAA